MFGLGGKNASIAKHRYQIMDHCGTINTIGRLLEIALRKTVHISVKTLPPGKVT